MKSNMSVINPVLFSRCERISFIATEFLAIWDCSTLPLNWIECINSLAKLLMSPIIIKLSWDIFDDAPCGVTDLSLTADLSNPDEYDDTSDMTTSILFSRRFLTIHSRINEFALLIAFITVKALIG